MKKLFYVITIILMLSVFPNYTAEAKTLSKPKIEMKYSTDDNRWYVRFCAPTKKAKVKYRLDYDKKYKSGKGKTKWLTTDEYDDFVVYVTDGKNKSKKVKYAIDKEIDKQKTADILNDTKDYVDKDADEFTKLAQLCDYYMYSGNFKYKYGCHPDYDWYYKEGACDYLANTFIEACKVYGIRAEFEFEKSIHSWTHVYLTGEEDSIVVDPSSLVAYKSICPSNTGAYVRARHIKLSKRDRTKYGNSVLCIKGATYSKDKVVVNAGENGCLPGYEDYYDIYTYSEDKHYWECHSYDANGIEGKHSDHLGDENDVCWCWYYGDEGCAGSITLTEGYVHDEY